MTDPRAALNKMIDALNARRHALGAGGDPAEKAALADQVDDINGVLAGLANADLDTAARRVARAADGIEAFLATVHIDPFAAIADPSRRAIADAAVSLADVVSMQFAADRFLASDPGPAEDAADIAVPLPPVAAPPPVAASPPPTGAAAPPSATGGALPPIVVGSKLAALAADYDACWAACKLRDAKRTDIAGSADRLMRGEARYKDVAARTKVPWQLIGLMHGLECGYDFNKHLHNGDRLDAPTHRVPAGRPPGWKGGTWEESAVDALAFKQLDRVADWPIARVLFALESFNGFGYRGKNVRSPYLWSFSNLYERGKFIADHVYDANEVSKQVGSAVVLKLLQERGVWP